MFNRFGKQNVFFLSKPKLDLMPKTTNETYKNIEKLVAFSFDAKKCKCRQARLHCSNILKYIVSSRRDAFFDIFCCCCLKVKSRRLLKVFSLSLSFSFLVVAIFTCAHHLTLRIFDICQLVLTHTTKLLIILMMRSG